MMPKPEKDTFELGFSAMPELPEIAPDEPVAVPPELPEPFMGPVALPPDVGGRDNGPPSLEPQPDKPRTPFGSELPSATVSGRFDAWAGIVVATHYAGADGVLGDTRTITVRRADYRWGTNAEPAGGEAPAAMSSLDPPLAVALPWPARHDQVAYHVAVDDIVTVITGRDGRCWYFSDELPFAAVVVKATTSVKEVQTGGAGQLSIKVRRQAISGDPSSAAATLADLQTAASADVEYDKVLVVCPDTQAHGYRCGDKVWVQRRGAYYFVVPGREWFVAEIVAAGPDSEADFGTTSPLYWVKEQDADIAYTGDTNTYALSFADRTATDPSGSGGRYGRWVCARNTAETTTHAVPTDGTVHVMVGIGRATGSGDTEAFYVFHSAQGAGSRYGKPSAAFSNASTLTLDPCDIHGTDNGEANVTGVYAQASQATLNLQSITLNGLARTPDCTLATTAVVKFRMANDGNWYLDGPPGWAIQDWIVDAANSKIQAKIQWRVGDALSTPSTEFDIHQGDDCDEAQDSMLLDWMGM